MVTGLRRAPPQTPPPVGSGCTVMLIVHYLGASAPGAIQPIIGHLGHIPMTGAGFSTGIVSL